jgi:excinuclease ABC subunit A
MKERRGDKVALLAPLVTNRKGFYTDLAKWALGKAVSHLRVDGEYLPDEGVAAPRPLPRAHDRAARGGARVDARERAAAARRRRSGVEMGKGVAARLLRRLGPPRDPDLLDEARVPLVRPQLPGARPAPLLVQLEARLVRRLLRHRPQARGVEWDDERARTGTEDHVLDSWVDGSSSTRRARMRRQAPQSRSARGALPRRRTSPR